jgi:hypothetical protein
MLQAATGSNHQPIIRFPSWSAFDFRGGLIGPPSGPIAGLPDEKNENRDHANHDKHPVLALETQKGEMLNEELHRARSLFVQDRRFGDENILFLYLLRFGAAQAREAALGQNCGRDGACELRSRLKCEVKR